jgi:hypothetical protein
MLCRRDGSMRSAVNVCRTVCYPASGVVGPYDCLLDGVATISSDAYPSPELHAQSKGLPSPVAFKPKHSSFCLEIFPSPFAQLV